MPHAPPRPSLLSRQRWPFLAAVAVAVTMVIWFIGGADGGLPRSRAGFADVSGSWRLDAAAYEAQIAAKEAHLSGRPDGKTEARLTAAQLRAAAAVQSKRTYTFLATSFMVTEGVVSRETPCTYVGQSPQLLLVVGEQPGPADDLTVILDPGLGRIHLRIGDDTLPFLRE